MNWALKDIYDLNKDKDIRGPGLWTHTHRQEIMSFPGKKQGKSSSFWLKYGTCTERR